jgi:hypothetical protein
VTRAHIAALVALAFGLAMTGAATGQPGDLFELRAGGSLDWVPTSGAIIVSSGSKLTESGVLTSPFGSAAFEESAGPGVARVNLAGSFTNPPLETRRLDPSTFVRATTRLTVTGPDGVVNVRLKAHVDATVLHACPASFTCTSGVTVFVGDHNTVVSQPGGASPNLLGLNVDPVPGGYRVHGDYVSPLRPVFANAAFDAILSLQLIVGNLGGGAADSSSFDARGEVSFPATGSVLEVPSGYTVTGESVEDNHWTDPFAPPPAPEIELRFADGSFIGPADVLDLGTIASGAASPPATFTIANTGTAALHVQPLTAPAGFAVDDQPDGTVAPGATTTAGLTCSSTNTGTAPLVLDDVVTVASDDPDEGALDLHVRCAVLPEPPSEPDIELRDAGGTPLPLPHLLDLGDVMSGSPATVGYRIANVGTGQLTIADITHDAPAGLGSATAPAVGTVQPGASTTAGVSCGGVNPGENAINVLFRVRVLSNDPDESPADLLVRCHVLPQAKPDIALLDGGGAPLPPGAVIDAGDVPSGETATRSYFIANEGNAVLTIVSVTATKPGFGSGVALAPDDTTIDPGDAARAQVTCGGTNTAETTKEVAFEVQIESDDPDENPRSFGVRCRVLPAPPDIALLDGDGAPLPAGAIIDAGDVQSGETATRSYFIANEGDSVLTIGSVSATTPAFGTGVAFAPDDTTIDPGDAARVQVSCGGTNTEGVYREVAFEIQIASDDPDENPISFGVRCRVAPARAEVLITYPDGSPMPSEFHVPFQVYVYDLGHIALGEFVTGAFRVANVGNADLFVNLDAFPNDLGAVHAVVPELFVLSPGESRVVPVRCGGSHVGPVSVQVALFTKVSLICKRDTTPPTISVPGGVTLDATSPAGAVVAYSTSATDDVDPAPQITCLPVSGSIFPIGTSTVACTAVDAFGNSASGSFTITVRGAVAQITALIAKTEAFVDSFGIEAALRATLRAAQQALAVGRKPPACVVLAAYIATVRALPNAYLSGSEKTQLIVDATRIRAVIPC